MKQIAIFASGGGTNAQNIIETFKDGAAGIRVSAVICNNSKAFVLERAKNLGVESYLIDKQFMLRDGSGRSVTDLLAELSTDYIILAGFLLKVPEELVALYPDRIINIHPALLPKYGGKGMYGHHVHEAVVAAGERESGITIHLVNEHYDSGRVLFQTKCALDPSDTPDDVAAKIHILEQANFPRVIAEFIGSCR